MQLEGLSNLCPCSSRIDIILQSQGLGDVIGGGFSICSVLESCKGLILKIDLIAGTTVSNLYKRVRFVGRGMHFVLENNSCGLK